MVPGLVFRLRVEGRGQRVEGRGCRVYVEVLRFMLRC